MDKCASCSYYYEKADICRLAYAGFDCEKCTSCVHWICDNGGHLCALTNYGEICDYKKKGE